MMESNISDTIMGKRGTMNFKKTQEHDQYKNNWCKENNITLIRIPYTHYEDIILKDLLNNSDFIKEI